MPSCCTLSVFSTKLKQTQIINMFLEILFYEIFSDTFLIFLFQKEKNKQTLNLKALNKLY